MAQKFITVVISVVFYIAGGCAVGPDYKRPQTTVPAAFKEAGDWKVAEPKDGAVHSAWWRDFGDQTLDKLELQLEVSNQSLHAAEAQYRQARALVRAARSAFFPTIGVQGAVTRSEGSIGNAASTDNKVINTYGASADLNWELDLWGRIRRGSEAARASAQAGAADLAGARLSLQAELATDYFNLRIVDAQKKLLERTVAAYEETVRLTQNRYDAGVVMRSDVVQAQVQLKSAQAQLIDVSADRAQLEHAIALLLGKPPSDFSLASVEAEIALPATPQTVPSDLLEQRPDIAGAERRVASANAQIGVARSAYFPQLTLSGSGGYRNTVFADLFSLPSRIWSVGPALAETLFDGDARRAESERTKAAYDESVAQYRQTVLTGFQEVEDNLAALRILADEAQIESEAVDLARESVRLITNQYKAGTVAYIDVVNLQATLYTNERTALALQGRRITAHINLVKALGGGWNQTQAPVVSAN